MWSANVFNTGVRGDPTKISLVAWSVVWTDPCEEDASSPLVSSVFLVTGSIDAVDLLTSRGTEEPSSPPILSGEDPSSPLVLSGEDPSSPLVSSVDSLTITSSVFRLAKMCLLLKPAGLFDLSELLAEEEDELCLTFLHSFWVEKMRVLHSF